MSPNIKTGEFAGGQDTNASSSDNKDVATPTKVAWSAVGGDIFFSKKQGAWVFTTKN